MLFSEKEKNRRMEVARKIMADEGLKAMFFVGYDKVGNGWLGDMRYFNDHRVLFGKQLIVLFADSEPVLFSGGDIQTSAAKRRSFIDDCRVCANSNDNYAFMVKLLKERGVTSGKIGTNLELLSAAGAAVIAKELPEIELVEVHPQVMAARHMHSDEEIEVLKASAKLCDGAYAEIKDKIRIGMDQSEIAAIIEGYMRAHGVEENFTLIATGTFALDGSGSLTLPYTAPVKSEPIKSGDCVVMEITPKYDGYWTQSVRGFCIGEDNADFRRIHDCCCAAIKAAVPCLKPGNTIAQVADAMNEAVKAFPGGDLVMNAPLGHICAIDLVEERVGFGNDFELIPGLAVIIHPTIYNKDRSVSFFWGETYLITEDGCEPMMDTDDTLYVVG